MYKLNDRFYCTFLLGGGFKAFFRFFLMFPQRKHGHDRGHVFITIDISFFFGKTLLFHISDPQKLHLFGLLFKYEKIDSF